MALEDHGIRGCLAALAVQEAAKRLAVDIDDPDAVDLQLRVGLNSGQVIAGEMGSGPFGYTTIGEQVGMAQRMESAAPPGGVMLSEPRDWLKAQPPWVSLSWFTSRAPTSLLRVTGCWVSGNGIAL